MTDIPPCICHVDIFNCPEHPMTTDVISIPGAGNSELNSRCALCGHEIVPSREDNWYEITGWVRGPKKDSLCLRNLSGLVAHDYCIRKAKAGIHPDDEALFPEE